MGIGIYERALLENFVTTKDGDYVILLEWLQQNINQSPDKKFVIDYKKLKKLLGPEFIKGVDTICTAIKKVLLKYGIRISTTIYEENNGVVTLITMRNE